MIKVVFIILSICAFALADDLTDAVGTTTVETLVSTTVPVIVTEPVVQATIESPVVETKEESPVVETTEESSKENPIFLSTIAPVENDLSSNSTLTNGTLKGVLKKVQQNLKQSVDQSLTVNSGGVTSQRCFMFLISFVLLFVFL